MIGESNDSWGNSKKHLGSATKFRILYLPGTRHETEKKISFFIEFTWPSLLLAQCDAIPMWFAYRNQVPLLEFDYYYIIESCVAFQVEPTKNKYCHQNSQQRQPIRGTDSPDFHSRDLIHSPRNTPPSFAVGLEQLQNRLVQVQRKEFSGEFFSGHLYKGQVGTWDKTRST